MEDMAFIYFDRLTRHLTYYIAPRNSEKNLPALFRVNNRHAMLFTLVCMLAFLLRTS